MNTRDEQIQEIELSIQEAKKAVAFGEALDRLLRNKDFQTVIDEGYMTAEARRLTLLLGDPNLTDSQRDSVTVSLRAIGELHTFFLARKSLAEQMQNAIEQAEAELEVIHAEPQEGEE
jgi:hypothetical protein